MSSIPLIRFFIDNKRHLPGLVVIVGISLISGVLKVLSATYWGKAVNYGVEGLINEMLFSAAMMAIFILLDCGRTALHYHIIGHITENMFLHVRAKAFEKVVYGDVAVLEREFRTGDVAARLNSDIDFLSTFSAGHISSFSRLIFSGLFGLIACVFISWQLSIAYLIILPVSVLLVGAVSRPIQLQSKRSMDSTGAAMSTAAGAVAGALTVKAFSAGDYLGEVFDKAVDSSLKQKVHSERISMKMTGIKYISNVMQTMCLFLLGSWLVSRGHLTVGAFIAFVTLSGYIGEAFNQMDYMIKSFRSASACAQRYYEVIDIPDEWSGPVKKPAWDAPLSCVASELSFSYEEDGRRVLENLNINIHEGQRVAVVGASGCGKSTLIKLICRFYLPQSGSLKIFGTESAQWNPQKLRDNLTIVTQDSFLFDGSFYDNISYGYPEVTRERCEEVLKEVSLWDFVSSFPDGMDHEIGEGGRNLSGGQKQRLCIARAIVKPAELVLLDEATSALDLQTEKEVQESLDKLLEGRTAVIIAHRLSTVQGVDYVYCMEDGCVVEEGIPKELLDMKGRYYEMCRLQGLV